VDRRSSSFALVVLGVVGIGLTLLTRLVPSEPPPPPPHLVAQPDSAPPAAPDAPLAPAEGGQEAPADPPAAATPAEPTSSEDAPSDWRREPPPAPAGGDEPSTDSPADQLARAAVISKLQSGIRAQLPAIRDCYDAWLKQDPALEGALRIEFTLVEGEDEDGEPIGLVDAVEVTDSELDNVWMEGCVAGAMEDADLPVPLDGELVVQYPFEFTRRQ